MLPYNNNVPKDSLGAALHSSPRNWDILFLCPVNTLQAGTWQCLLLFGGWIPGIVVVPSQMDYAKESNQLEYQRDTNRI